VSHLLRHPCPILIDPHRDVPVHCLSSHAKRTIAVTTENSATVEKESEFLLTSPPTANAMSVTKRNGSTELVDLNKIVRAVQRSAEGLHAVDPMRVATRTISGLYNGATTQELDELSIRTAALLIGEEPEYGRLAARLLANFIAKEVSNQEIHAFSQSVGRGHEVGLINDRLLNFVQTNARKLNDAIDTSLDFNFDYFGLRTLYDRYLLRHPHSRKVIETPQQFFLRIASALSEDVPETLALYRRMGNLDYLPSSPTLFNSGTTHEQLSSCFLLDSPQDSLESIYSKYADIAQLSKFSGGIGVSYTRVRSRGSLQLHPRAFARFAHQVHQRPFQRHRAVAEDHGFVRGRGEPGRQAQGRGLRLPGNLARRRRGFPGAA